MFAVTNTLDVTYVHASSSVRNANAGDIHVFVTANISVWFQPNEYLTIQGNILWYPRSDSMHPGRLTLPLTDSWNCWYLLADPTILYYHHPRFLSTVAILILQSSCLPFPLLFRCICLLLDCQRSVQVY